MRESMKKNVGGIDRVAFFNGSLWVWIGVVSLLTGCANVQVARKNHE
ncbi:hypothetical protein CRYPD_169 [uncultured Candidatus Thioglobus sp.]|nr:hypothetical protein CRYPD_169 [uncultured Candidatus Thioglobus sp.]